MNKVLLLASACVLAAAALAGQNPKAPTAAPSGTDPAFAKFVDDYFDASFAYSPLQGTSAGFHQYDAKMPDRSRAAFEKRIAALKAQLARLQASTARSCRSTTRSTRRRWRDRSAPSCWTSRRSRPGRGTRCSTPAPRVSRSTGS